MSRAEVRDRALSFDTQLVLITGGEPLLQAATLPLLTELCDARRTVLLETSGERDIGKVDPRVRRIVDLKAPASGESARNRMQNIALLTARDELKFVLKDRADYVWARDLIAYERLIGRVHDILLSPVHGELDPRELVSWTLADRLEVRVQLQLHKYIWGKDAQGV